MKQFEDLTRDELVKLTQEQIDYYVDLACAEDGVPLLPPEPGPKPEKPDVSPDLEVYRVGDMHFRECSDAEAVASLANDAPRVTLSYVSGWRNQRAEPDNIPRSVTTEKAWSPGAWDRHKKEITDFEEREKYWEEDSKAFREASSKRSEATSWIFERLSEARSHVQKRERFEAELQRYMELADGDRKVAERFLLNAHPEARDFIELEFEHAPDSDQVLQQRAETTEPAEDEVPW